MPTTAKPRRREGVRNTFGLPRGEAIRKALVAVFREQRRAALGAIRKGKSHGGVLLAIRGLLVGNRDRRQFHGGSVQPATANPPLARLKDLGNFDPLSGVSLPDFRLGSLKMSERMTPLLEALWDAAGRQFNSRIGLDPDAWEVTNPHTRGMIEWASLDFCESTNETTSLDLQTALRKTREELIAGVVTAGESIPKLTKRVNAIFDGAERWRARRIAQTEASRAVHAAQEQAAKESGVVAGFEWLASSDACPMCLEVASKSKYVRLGDKFATVGDNPAYRDVRYPPLHPHCNCTVVEVLLPEYGGPSEVGWSGPAEQPTGEGFGEPEPPPKPDPADFPPDDYRSLGVDFRPSEQSRDAGEKTVTVDVAALDGSWAEDEGYYVPPGGEGGGAIGGRYAAAAAYLDRAMAEGLPFDLPRVGVTKDGRIGFVDGRHRFAVLRDRGIVNLPVSVPPGEARRMARLYGWKGKP